MVSGPDVLTTSLLSPLSLWQTPSGSALHALHTRRACSSPPGPCLPRPTPSSYPHPMAPLRGYFWGLEGVCPQFYSPTPSKNIPFPGNFPILIWSFCVLCTCRTSLKLKLKHLIHLACLLPTLHFPPQTWPSPGLLCLSLRSCHPTHLAALTRNASWCLSLSSPICSPTGLPPECGPADDSSPAHSWGHGHYLLMAPLVWFCTPSPLLHKGAREAFKNIKPSSLLFKGLHWHSMDF